MINATKVPRMRRCPKCWIYTFKERCPICGNETVIPHPEPFSVSLPSYDKSKSRI